MKNLFPRGNNKSSILPNLLGIIQALKEMYSKHLQDISGDDINNIYIKINMTPSQEVNIMMFNTQTKTIVSKKYPIVKLLRNCSDIFSVNNMVLEDCKVMYKKSKETVYNVNTVVEV